VEFSRAEEQIIAAIHANMTAAAANPQQALQAALPALSTSLVFRLRQAAASDPTTVSAAANNNNVVLQQVAVALNDLLEAQLRTARATLQDFLGAGEIRLLDALIGKAQRAGRLDTAFFQVLTLNLQDAAAATTTTTTTQASSDEEEGATTATPSTSEAAAADEPAASRAQILQHIYTRCQEEVEKSIPPGLALLNKLLRTPQMAIRRNLYTHYLTPQKTSITSPDGQEIALGGTSQPLVALEDFMDALALVVRQIRTAATVGATDRVSAATMVESTRDIAKEARAILGESYGVASDELRTFEEGLLPVFRPATAESPYMTGEAE
jgi:hypothetical protein